MKYTPPLETNAQVKQLPRSYSSSSNLKHFHYDRLHSLTVFTGYFNEVTLPNLNWPPKSGLLRSVIDHK